MQLVTRQQRHLDAAATADLAASCLVFARVIYFSPLPTMPDFAKKNNATTQQNHKNSDNQAIQAIKAAVAKPKTPQLRLIECEFPPLQELNKLGDGSWQSAKQVDGANLAFGTKCCQALSPLLGNRPTLLTSSSATASFFQQAQKAFGQTASLKNGPPQGTMRNDIFVLVAPSGPDYVVAKQLATQGATVVLINGFAKVRSNVVSLSACLFCILTLVPRKIKGQQKCSR